MSYLGGAVILGFFLGMVLFNRLVVRWYENNGKGVEHAKTVYVWEFSKPKPWWVRLHQYLGQY